MHERKLGVWTAYVSDEEKTSPKDYIHTVYILEYICILYFSIFLIIGYIYLC